MDNTINEIQINLDCPICLFPLIQPITLSCGHSFCQPCIRNTYFLLSHSSCPLCRNPLIVAPRQYKVNLLLEQVLLNCYSKNEDYMRRLHLINLHKQRKASSRSRRLIRTIYQVSLSVWNQGQRLIPLFTIVVLVIIILSIKQNILNNRLKVFEKHLMDEVGKIVTIMKQSTGNTDFNKDVDMQNLVFSKLVKYLFTSCVRF